MTDETTRSTDAPVLVVGAGPVGMSAALALRARGVPVTILEADPEDRERPGSRADYVHGSTLSILEAIHPGLGWRLVDAGLNPSARRTFWAGEEIYSRTFPPIGDSDELPHSTRIPQTAVESFLLEALAERDVEVHWDAAVESVDSSPDGVTVETADGRTWDAAYLVGADGGGSTVRKQVGLSMAGTESVNTFVIVDVEEVDERPRANELHFHYGHPGVGDRNVLIAPFAGGWRIDVTCRTSDDPEAMTREERVREIVAATVGARYADRVSWVSTYRFKQVLADRMVDGAHRVLLAGDAAHLFAPFGGRGMNSGIHDADAAASAIAVARGADAAANGSPAGTESIAEREVENYARLRGAAAEWNEHAAGQALEHIYSERLLPNLKKRVAGELAPWFSPAAEWLDTAHFGPHEGPPIPTLGKF